MKLSDYDDAVRTHFWGLPFLVLAVLPHMRIKETGGSSISRPSAEFALAGLSDGLRAELARDRSVVTTVCPGLMRTGSPINVTFKGQGSQEYSWFAIASSLSVPTISAERAARQILDACRRGDAELVITVQAQLAVLARTIAPEVFSDAMSLVQRLLPRPVGPEGDIAEPGRSAGSKWVPSMVLAPMYAAARRNNEL